MKYVSVLASVVLALGSYSVFAQQTLLLRTPDISAEHLAFVYAGDIWVADRDGSKPRRLTSSPVAEGNPKFSPDGSQIAFAASFENNGDVYVVPTAGGQPKRLTWHPGADTPTGWTADGNSVTVVSARETDHGRSGQLYHASVDGGLPEKQMEARVMSAVYGADDSRLAFTSFRAAYNGLFGGSSGWKGYGGGSAPPMQIMDIADQQVKVIPGHSSTNFNPIWIDGTPYFISDREDKLFNIYRYDSASNDVEKVSMEDLWDVRAAGGHGSDIVYEAGGRLFALNTVDESVNEIPINISPDLPQLRTQWKNADSAIDAADISPSGKRAIITARGDVFTIAVDDGPTRNLTGSGSVREYSAIWSPEGEQVAYITDSLGGQSLVIADQLGGVAIAEHRLGDFYYELQAWSSGDVPRITYTDNHAALYTVNVADGDIEKVSTGIRRDQIEAAFSPDGQWLAYTEEQANYHRDLMLRDLSSGQTTRLSDGAADVAAPTFSRDGSYLYFAASTNSGPLQIGLNMTSQEWPYRAALYAIVLAADGKSPLLPESGDESVAEDADDEAADDDEEEEETEQPTQIDLPGLASRIVALPVAENNYSGLQVASDGNLYFVRRVQPGISTEAPGDNAASENALMRFDFAERESQIVGKGVNGFAISADGSHMIIANIDGSLAVAEIGDELEPESLNLSDVRTRIDPREEWGLIFDEAWRMEKEYFYDPNLHGLDWQAIYNRYRPLVEHVGRREDLAALIVEMIAEMQVGHNRSGGGDIHREQGANTGLLGANLRINNGRYQISRVYTGESWNPFVDAPLATPGNEARDGDYILAINGRELTGADNIYEYLQGTADSQVTLRVGASANGNDTRDITIEPTASERTMRLWAWIENNRRIVSEATDGRVGYVYLPNTAGAGYTFFNRMFFAQVDKEAMIIDERSNGGGQAANYITDVLSRQHLSGWKDRDGLSYNTPAGAMHGPKVMLIDQDAGSGGDFLPYSFREMGIGKLIGTRTWGGLIGISANPQLVDGGGLTVPFFRFYDSDHNWTVENQGVAPDIEVTLDAIATNEGRDTQLEVAISEVLQQLESFVSPIPGEAPAYPTALGE
ncbi:MAG: peptidase S41 [Woeseia sp.]|jgi:tricorn protease|nr:peptidase S41 [Woeseia sp.]